MRISSDSLPILSRAFARHSCECRTSILKIFMCPKLVANWSRSFLNRFKSFMQMFSSKYFARLSRDCRNNENENKPHSRESRETLFRMSRDCRATVARYIFKIRPKFANLSHKCPFNRMQRKSCVCLIVNLCREIVENYSQTSLQLSHTSEVGVLS